jgi:hypothetical protein
VIEYATERGKGPRLRVGAQIITAGGRQFSIRVAELLHEFQESRERFEGILLSLSVPALLLAALGAARVNHRETPGMGI